MMGYRALLAAAALLAPPAAAAAEPPPVVPAPASVEARAGSFPLGASAVLAVEEGDAGARRAAERLAGLLSRSHGVKPPVRAGLPANAIRFIRARELGAEAYRIDAGPRGITVHASTDAGFSHAVATLWQLATRSADGVSIPALAIEDAPRFAWRGVLLDSARHFQSPEFLRRFIDWMALHKLNVLHWHLTDDQAWRLEIRKYPRLAQVGGWRVPAGAAPANDIDPATGKPRLYGGYYTQETVRSLVAYAAERGITIVPEIEMPGHASAAIVAYPRLASTAKPPESVPADWGVYHHAYSPAEETFAFLEDVLREVMALFPSRYIHVGGDEVEKTEWREWPAARARMASLGIDDASKLQVYFTQRIARFLEANGRRLVGWDEILEPGLPQGAVVMSWRGIDGALAAAAKGHDTVLAALPTLYFDNVQALSPREPPGRGRVVTLKDVYEFEPMPAAIAPDARRHVLGLQGNVWTEHIRTEERVAYMTFPRAAAIAELGWSRPERRGWEGFRKRMQALAARYPDVGLAARPLSDAPAPAASRALRSQELKLCSEHIALSLEDDAPVAGPRAAFLVDVQNPCWIIPGAALDRVEAIAARVGQVPFNFQIGEDVKKIRFPKPETKEGELEVRVGGCEGELMARLPLAPAASSHAVTALPAAPVKGRPGRHDVCLRFAQHALDPMWVIDSIELVEAPR
jgi:hexosaminidase